MVRPGYVLTRKEASDIFLILSTSRLKLTGKVKTAAEKYWKKFEEALGLSPTFAKDKANSPNKTERRKSITSSGGSIAHNSEIKPSTSYTAQEAKNE